VITFTGYIRADSIASIPIFGDDHPAGLVAAPGRGRRAAGGHPAKCGSRRGAKTPRGTRSGPPWQVGALITEVAGAASVSRD
jgi:hypothetical protein